MQLNKLRNRLFYALTGGKILIILWVMILWVGASYSASQAREILLLILPLFVANITLAFNFWFKQAENVEERTFPAALRYSSFLFLALYVFFVIAMIGYYSTLSGEGEGFTALKDWIGIAEMAFGAFVGLIFSNLFVDRKLE